MPPRGIPADRQPRRSWPCGRHSVTLAWHSGVPSA